MAARAVWIRSFREKVSGTIPGVDRNSLFESERRDKRVLESLNQTSRKTMVRTFPWFLQGRTKYKIMGKWTIVIGRFRAVQHG